MPPGPRGTGKPPLPAPVDQFHRGPVLPARGRWEAWSWRTISGTRSSRFPQGSLSVSGDWLADLLLFPDMPGNRTAFGPIRESPTERRSGSTWDRASAGRFTRTGWSPVGKPGRRKRRDGSWRPWIDHWPFFRIDRTRPSFFPAAWIRQSWSGGWGKLPGRFSSAATARSSPSKGIMRSDPPVNWESRRWQSKPWKPTCLP